MISKILTISLQILIDGGIITRRGGAKAAPEAWTSVHRSKDGIEVAAESIFVCNIKIFVCKELNI